MPKTRRNEPCPCGSGRKQKSCCGNAGREAEFIRARILRVEAELARKVVAWGRSTYGASVIEDAWAEFTTGVFGPAFLFDEMAAFAGVFIPWWLYGGSQETGGARSPVREFLDQSGAPADGFERRLVRTIEAAPFSFHRVADVASGRSLTLEDVFTRTTRVVRDNAASTESCRSTYIYARVAAVDGVDFLFGSGPVLVEPSRFTILKSLRDELREENGRRLTDEDLHRFDAEIRINYLHIASATLNPAPPQLTNTDGDPIAPTLLVYDLDCDCETAFDKLWTLAHGWKRADLLRTAEHDEVGFLIEISFNWVKRGPGIPGRGKPILGFLHLEPGRLEIEVNSQKRAKRIRASIARRLGKNATYRHAVVESIEKMIEQMDNAPPESGSNGADRDPAMDSPEVQAMLAQAMAQHWKAWFDQSIPALEGRTPREAARTEEGRELLQALLADYEFKAQRLPDNPGNADTDALRRELGLPACQATGESG